MALRLRGATSGYIELKAPASAGDNTLTLPVNNGSANQILKTDGNGNLSWTDDNSGVSLSGSTNNTITTVTGANALIGEANLTFDGTTLLNNSDTAALTLRDSSAYAATTGPQISFQGKDSNQATKAFGAIKGLSISADNGQLRFQTRTGGTLYDRMTIDQNGNVGIGTTSPASLLHIADATEPAIRLQDTNAVNSDFKIYSPDGDNSLRIYHINTSSDLFHISSGGDVGIGTTSPTAELDIERTTGTVEVQLQSRDSSDCFVSFGDNSDSDIGQIRYAHSDNSMSFKTNTNERLSIDFEGKVIMGSGGITTDSSERFFVDGSGANDHCGLGIKTNNATYDGFIAFHDTDTNNQGAIRYTHSQDRMKFRTGGNNERICLDSDGLKFHGDTAAANALNDYEEGTFTPTIGFASNSANDWTYNAQQGTYIKVGNLCHFVLRIDIGNAGSGNDGWVEIAGLPFGMYNMMSGISYEGTCNCDVHDAASNITGPRAIIYQSANKLMLINSNSTDSFFASGNQISKSDLIQASTDIRIRGTYRTT